MGSELCKTCIHTKVCMKDKNLIGDVFVMGHPMFFDNEKLYEKYKERERQGFPCEDYMPPAEPKKGKWIKNNGDVEEPFYHCSVCEWDAYTMWDYCPKCGADMRVD